MNETTHYSPLYLLIKSLDSNEKAYYKKLAKRHSNNNEALHLKLFDLIDAAKEEDQNTLAKKLKVKTAAQLSGVKSYLWNDLLSTIVFLKRHETIQSQLNFYVVQLELLINRGMIEGAKKHFTRAWALATEHEIFDEQINLLNIGITLDKYQTLEQYEDSFFRSQNLLRQIAERQAAFQQLDNLLNHLVFLRKTSYMRFSEKQMDNIHKILHETRKVKIDTSSPLLRIFSKTVLSITYHLALQLEESEELNTELLELFNDNTHLIGSNGLLFIYAADNTLYNDYALNKTGQALHHLEAFDSLAKKYVTGKRLSQLWEIIHFNNELKYYHKTGNYAMVAELFDKEAGQIVKTGTEVLTPYRQLTLRCSLCITAFVLEKYEIAQDYLIDIKQLNREEQSEDVLYFTSIFELLILFERKDWYQLSNVVTASYLQLYNKKQLQPFEKEVMLFLKKFSSTRSKQQIRENISSFLERLQEYKSDPTKKFYFLYFNYHGWLESKVLGEKYTDHIKKQLKVPLTAE